MEEPRQSLSPEPPADDWDDRLARIDWSKCFTAYGEASPVQSQLRQLRSANTEEAIKATHDLWCGLCHQHVQIASAALPALPFLLEVFSTADDRMKIELLDIFLGLATTSNPRRLAEFAAVMGRSDLPRPQWIDDVRSGLENALPSILPLRTHADPDIADFANEICDELECTSTSVQALLGLNRLSAPRFDAAVSDFAAFLVKQGYPPNLLWVNSADVVVHKWNGTLTYFVRKGDPVARERSARKDYQGAISRNVGFAFEAQCRTDRWAICRIFVPVDEHQAERLMIPQTGAKHAAVQEPAPTILVERDLWWRILRWLARRSSPVWE